MVEAGALVNEQLSTIIKTRNDIYNSLFVDMKSLLLLLYYHIQWVLRYTRFGLHSFGHTRLRKIISTLLRPLDVPAH